MNNRVFKVFISSLLLSCFFGIAACVTTSGPVAAPAAPSYSPQPPEQNDPLFWDMWESAHGVG